MKKLIQATSALLALGLALFGCTGGGSGSSSTLAGQILAPSFASSPSVDLSGQASVYSGPLGHGTAFTFAAITGATYIVNVSTQSNDNLVMDVFSRDGSELKGKEFTGGTAYLHTAVSQHVLMLIRPSDELNTGIQVNSINVLGTGNYSQSTLAINIIVAGDDFTGFGNFNDLAATADRQNLAASLAQSFQALHDANNTGIKLSFEGFSLTTAQVKAAHPDLVDSLGHTICGTQPETVNAQGFGDIDTAGLDEWGDYGFPATAPDTQAANALDVFIIHHFSTDGVVGLSPRPGTALLGNGPGHGAVHRRLSPVGRPGHGAPRRRHHGRRHDSRDRPLPRPHAHDDVLAQLVDQPGDGGDRRRPVRHARRGHSLDAHRQRPGARRLDDRHRRRLRGRALHHVLRERFERRISSRPARSRS